MISYKLHNFEKEEHLALMERWYEKRNFPVIPFELLPKIGLVVSHDGAFIAMGFLYRTDGGVASIAHLATSPVAASDERHIALDLIISNLMKIAEDQKYKMVTIASNLERLFERFEKFGFKITDENVKLFGRSLCLGE